MFNNLFTLFPGSFPGSLSQAYPELLWTLFTLIALVFFQRSIYRHIQSQEGLSPGERRRRWVTVRNWVFFLALFSNVVIWVNELLPWLVSILALVVALTVAARDLILCLAGSIYRSAVKPFKVGHRISVQSWTGDVIDSGLFSTELLEINADGLYTGRSITLPNSVFLSHPIQNENFLKKYGLSLLKIQLTVLDDLELASELLLKIAKSQCAAFLPAARLEMMAAERRASLDLPSVEPKVILHMEGATQVFLVLRFPSLPREKAALEQSILRQFLKIYRPSLPEKYSNPQIKDIRVVQDMGIAVDGFWATHNQK